MRRYSILGVRYGTQRETEIAQVDSNPEAVSAAAQQQTVTITNPDGRRVSVSKWNGVRTVENKQ
jgi:hypothetical protein